MTTKALSGNTIAIVINDLSFLRSHRDQIVLEALSQGATIHLYAPCHSENDRALYAYYEDLGCRFFSLPLTPRSRSLLEPVRVVLSLLQLLRRNRPDLVHLITIKAILYGGVASALLSIPTIITFPGMGMLFSSRSYAIAALRLAITTLYRCIAKRASLIIVQNSADMQLIRELVPQTPIELIAGSGVTLSSFSYPAQGSSPPQILFVGRLLLSKGILDFIEVARSWGSSGGSSATFIIAGKLCEDHPDGIALNSLNDLCRELSITYLRDHQDIPKLLSQCNVLVIPSQYGEGVPKVVLEGLAAGVPIVAYDNAGIREVITHEVTGIIVPAGDTTTLTEQTVRITSDTSLARNLAVQGRLLIEQKNLTESHVAQRTVEFYSKVVHQNTPSRY
jgi:glycosyltransferase involved in cell wall biosynthesis